MSGNFYLEIDAVDWSAKISTAINVCCLKELKFFGQIREDAEFKGLYIAGNPEPVDRCVFMVHRHYGPVGFATFGSKAAAGLSDTRKSHRTPRRLVVRPGSA
jgi:hypothetical protein